MSKQIQIREMSAELRQLEFDDRDKYERRDLEENSVQKKKEARKFLLNEKIQYLNKQFYDMESDDTMPPPVEWRSLKVPNKE